MPGEHDEVDREAIAALHRRDERAAKEQDFATLRSLMDDDAVVMEPGRRPLRGRAELDKSFAKRSAGGAPVVIEDYRLEFEEIEIVGDRAIEWGRIVGRLRTLESGETSELAFNDMRVPAETQLPLAKGLSGPLSCLSEARYGIIWGAMGAARACYEAALDYSKNRVQFDRPIAGFQLTQEKLVNMLVELGKGTLLALHLGRMKDSGGLHPAHVSFGKLNNVREAIAITREARTILGQVGNAILAAASVAVLAGLAVLLGAIAAARASRLYDNVILRVLGASRRQLLLLQLAEYGLLALVLAGVALGLGSGLAWLVIVELFEFDWLPDWPRILAVLGTGLLLVLAFALGGSLPLLRARPAQALREL